MMLFVDGKRWIGRLLSLAIVLVLAWLWVLISATPAYAQLSGTSRLG